MDMVDDLKSIREVAIALDAIKGRLNLMTAVFAGTIGICVIAFGYLFLHVGILAESTARLDGRLDGIERLLVEVHSDTKKLTEDMGRLKGAMKLGALEDKTTPDPFSFSGMLGVQLGPKVVQKFSTVVRENPPDEPIWIYSPDKSFIGAVKDIQP